MYRQKVLRTLHSFGIETFASNNYKWNNSSLFPEDISSKKGRCYVAIPATVKKHLLSYRKQL